MAFTSQPGYIEPGLFHPGALEAGTTEVSGADTNSTAESQNLVVSLTKTDTGSGTETNSLVASLNGADTASGSESYSIVVQVSSTDEGSATDLGSVSVSVSSTDSASTSEGQSLALSVFDTASGTESQSLSAIVSGSDTSSLAESEDVTELDSPFPDDDDTGHGTESVEITATLPTFSDTASSSESHSIVVTLSGSDTGSSSEGLAEASAAVSSSDTGSLSDETEDFVLGAEGLDTVSVIESESIAVTLSSADSGTGVDSHKPFPAPPVEIGDYIVSLVMGPATVYVADFDTPEPLDSDITTVPSFANWMDIGTTLDGVVMTVKQEFENLEVVQNSEVPGRRLKRRHIEVDLSMAEPTLTNMLYAMNSGELQSGSGFTSYSPPFLDRATPLTYRAVMIDGWAPGFSETSGKHRRRRVILRKCLSIDDTSLGYTKDDLTACNVKWTVHRVDGVTTPFKIIDEE